MSVNQFDEMRIAFITLGHNYELNCMLVADTIWGSVSWPSWDLGIDFNSTLYETQDFTLGKTRF